jgi:hypothetical protein
MLRRVKEEKGYVDFCISQLNLVRSLDETLKWKGSL